MLTDPFLHELHDAWEQRARSSSWSDHVYGAHSREDGTLLSIIYSLSGRN